MKGKRKTGSKNVTLGLLIVYLVVMTWIILFKMELDINEPPQHKPYPVCGVFDRKREGGYVGGYFEYCRLYSIRNVSFHAG